MTHYSRPRFTSDYENEAETTSKLQNKKLSAL